MCVHYLAVFYLAKVNEGRKKVFIMSSHAIIINVLYQKASEQPTHAPTHKVLMLFRAMLYLYCGNKHIGVNDTRRDAIRK